ncbi:NADH:flavin oxidoreductase/NADH oxidase [Paludibacter propionicigenes WB4]|uniref:NADH:flavin oxidoreductase/NADH oxidase n=1 Tax=Paludibacter propionicigenes (strain DSM 17365 / JCM 13257 / WB4) TaxID=694427 RepID=E4T611_PALPW|nr:NADH:flavin oxidoreductase/NADH oxidase [Paludibacter propionicigenes]ADQ80155.1 NADH:flavin oxidoreductase/NADH oxidase [Paludibacter propionicigenes WB4]
MSRINEPLSIKSVTIKNRIGLSPMCQYSATDGLVNDWHIVHYGTRAVGGVGLLMLEATAVAPEGRITPFDLGLWDDNQIAGLERITRFAHEHGATTAIQIAHAGRKASHDSPANGGKQLSIAEGGWQTVAPSAIPFDSAEIPPHELNETEIEHIVQQFTATARRAKQAGFDVLEIHAAHGYLVHQFLSPLSNKRTDEYGGSFENRIRLLLKIVAAVKTDWPQELPLFVRLSATDWTEGGWNLEETVKLSEILHRQGVDLIDCSSGGNISNAKIPLSPGYQVHFSEEIKKTGVLTAAVGLITTVEQMNSILVEGKADMIFLGRELLRNPYFPIVSTLRTDGESEWPIQYLRGK